MSRLRTTRNSRKQNIKAKFLNVISTNAGKKGVGETMRLYLSAAKGVTCIERPSFIYCNKCSVIALSQYNAYCGEFGLN